MTTSGMTPQSTMRRRGNAKGKQQREHEQQDRKGREAKVKKLKDGYEEALKELGDLRKKQREQQVSKLLDAMDKSGKTFEEVIRLIKL